jgi:hypothetical protein
MMHASTETAGRRQARRWRVRSAVVVVVALAAVAALAPPAGAAGVQDFSYSGVIAPTADKPQSKLWIADGFWWASLWNRVTVRHEIYRLDWASQTWASTGVPIDARRTSTSDILWDGSHLYVASSGPNAGLASQSARVYRFSYDPAHLTYTLDPGFPVTVSAGGMEAVVLAKDTRGVLWVTFTQNNQAFTAHSTFDDLHWSAPAVLPFQQASNLAPDDIASIVAFDGKIGVMWSDQGDPLVEAFQFATHVDGAPATQWTLSAASSGDHAADDHINLKALSGDPAGRVFAATKTSSTVPGNALEQLLVLGPGGTWSQHTFGTVADNQTRSQVLLDTEHRRLYMYVSAPCCSGGSIFAKSSSIDSVSFTPAAPTPLIALPSAPKINNPTSTKQPLSSSTGMVVLGGDDSTAAYVHTQLPLGPDTRPPDTRIASGPAGATDATTARFLFASDEAAVRFECRLDAGGFVPCSMPADLSGLAPGLHTFFVRAVDSGGNADGTPAAASWTVLAPPAAVTGVGAGAGAGVPATAPPAAAVRRAAALRLVALARQRLGRRGRLRVSVTCRATCRAVIHVRIRGVGRLHVVRRIAAGRTVAVVVRLRPGQLRAARRLLARGRTLAAIVTVTAIDRAGRRLPGVRSVIRLLR